MPLFLATIVIGILYNRTVSSSFVSDQNAEPEEVKKYITSKHCTGTWCKYVKKCYSKTVEFQNDKYVDGLCKLLVKELDYALLSNFELQYESNKVTIESELSEKQQKVLDEIQVRYLNFFLEYIEVTSHHIGNRRFRRYSKRKGVVNNVNGVQFDFFRDTIRSYDFSDIIFIYDDNQMFLQQDNELVKHMSVIQELTNSLLRELNQLSFSFMNAKQLINELGESCNNTLIGGLTMKSAFFVLSDTISTRKVITKFSCNGQINGDIRWFVLQNMDDKNEAIADNYLDSEFLPKAKIEIDSNFYIFKAPSRESSVIYLYEGYRKEVADMSPSNSNDKFLLTGNDRYKDLIVNYWGVWKERQGIKSTGIPMWDRRADLHGVHLRCAAAANPPFQIVTPLKGDKEGQIMIDGYMADLWSELQRITNFSYVLYPSVDGSWGSLSDDGNWSGMIGMILRDEVDFAVSDFFITLDRSYVVDFSMPLLNSQSKMYIPIPSQAAGLSTFVNPFSNQLWLATILMILISSVIISITYYVHIFVSYEDVDYPNNFGINMSLFLSFASLCQQGIEFEAKRFSTRVATITILFATLVVFAAYSASLTSFLAIFKVEMPFSDLETMYYETNYKIGSIRNTAFDNLFKAGNELDKKIFEDRQDFVGSVNEGLEKSNNEQFAFLWDAGTMDFLIGKKCSHIAIPKTVLNAVIAFVIRKKSPYTSMFNYFISKLQESGQLSRMWSKWKAEVRKDCFDNGATGLGLSNVIAAFLVIGVAIFVSGCLMAFERLWRIKIEEQVNTKHKWSGKGMSANENIEHNIRADATSIGEKEQILASNTLQPNLSIPEPKMSY